MSSGSEEISPSRERILAILASADGASLQTLFVEEWFNSLIPDAARMVGCGQGDDRHLEGDVAIHTGLVLDWICKITVRRLGRSADLIEKLAAIVHDCRKPVTRIALEDGSVTFPGHEVLAAEVVPAIGRRLQLTADETARLEFAVRYHGDAHSWPELSEELKARLRASPFFDTLALLQEADALGCVLPGDKHLPVYWDEMCEEEAVQGRR